MSTTPDPAGPVEGPDDAGTDAAVPDAADGVAAADREPAPAAPVEQEPVEVELPADARVEATDVDVNEAVQGRTRRAPRYQNFLKAGALLGAVVGLFVGGFMLTLDGVQQIDKPGVLFSLIVIAGICVGLGVAGLLAVLADRRSLGRRA
ncbi:hypothetical protein [Luteimicrobium sp. DT211]|uniref:hypothetical protein n=1 Tax=Luteimicrobium sp. DT211 TaxID=3393412 RepID=UPI003CF812D3